MNKAVNNIAKRFSPLLLIIVLVLVWEGVSLTGVIPRFMLPSPIEVLEAFIEDFTPLMVNAQTTLAEAFFGVAIAVLLAFIVSFFMDRFKIINDSVYPLLVITQTIPTVAIAPLLVLWLGYGISSKIILVVVSCFFPIAVGLIDGYKSADKDSICLMRTMGASEMQIYKYIKLPSSMGHFFAGLRIAVSYSIVGAVIAEWLGGYSGLGVYMTRVKKSYAFDKMFAVIFLISIISLALIKVVWLLQTITMPWNKGEKDLRTNKRIIKQVSFFLLPLLILIFIFYSYSGSINKNNLEKVSFVLDWTPNTNHTGLYVAKKLGYFKELNIDVEVNQPPEDSSMALVGSGRSQFGVGFQDSLAMALSSKNTMPITALAAVVQHNTLGIISLKGSGINRPKGLENKTYATWGLPIEQEMIRYAVKNDGGNPNKINMVPNTVTDVVAALKTNIDAVCVYYAWDGIATKVKGLKTDYFSFKDVDPSLDFYTPIIIANTDYISRNPEVTRRFMSALSRGYEYAILHPEESAGILLEFAPELDENITKESQVWLSQRYKEQGQKWGVISQDRWDGFYDWLYDNRVIEQRIEKGRGFTNEYL